MGPEATDDAGRNGVQGGELSSWDRYRALAPRQNVDPGVTYRARNGGGRENRGSGHPYAESGSNGQHTHTTHGSHGGKHDYYALLGVPRNATGEEIERAYRRYVVLIHPDKCFNDPKRHAVAQEQLKAVNGAMQVLRDPGIRAQYDAILAGLPLASRMGRLPRNGKRTPHAPTR